MNVFTNLPSLLTRSTVGNDVGNVSQVPQVETNRARGEMFSQIDQYRRHLQYESSHKSVAVTEENTRRTQYPNDRRKVSQRIRKNPVLVELRSGVDRRRRHMRSTDTIVHIDEEV